MDTGLTDKMASMRDCLVAVMKKHIADYEEKNSEVKPAPRWAQLPQYPSKKQQASYMKMLLQQAQKQNGP
jgi:hypothetical protein